MRKIVWSKAIPSLRVHYVHWPSVKLQGSGMKTLGGVDYKLKYCPFSLNEIERIIITSNQSIILFNGTNITILINICVFKLVTLVLITNKPVHSKNQRLGSTQFMFNCLYHSDLHNIKKKPAYTLARICMLILFTSLLNFIHYHWVWNTQLN